MEIVIFLAGVVVGVVLVSVAAGLVARRQEAEMRRMVRDFEESGVALARRRADGSLERVDPGSVKPRTRE